MRRFLCVLWCLQVALLAQYPGAKPIPESLQPGLETITPESCREILAFLTSEACAGRGTGSPGYDVAADYVAKQFAAAGLEPVGEGGSYFQKVPFKRFRVDAQKSRFVVADSDLVLAIGTDLELEASEGTLEGPLVFIAGTAALEDPSVLRNAFVIVTGEALSFREGLGAQSVRDRPRAILRVVDQVTAPKWRSSRGDRPGRGRTVGSISKAATERLVAACGLEMSVLTPRGATPVVTVPVKPRVGSLTIAVENSDQGVPNVVGLLRGSDPALSSEVVICGSHLDHLGEQGGRIHPGADDDGSGSTGLMVLARALAANPIKPRRSVLFLAFCGEELGLVGSAYYTEHPIIPIEKSVAELQMDMIGRREEKAGRGGQPAERPEDNVRTTHLVGSKRLSMELHESVIAANEHLGFEFEYDEEDVYTRSDHYNFAKKGIPIAFFFSGFHPDYHQPSDTPEKIDYDKLANTAKLVYMIVHRVGSADARPKVERGR